MLPICSSILIMAKLMPERAFCWRKPFMATHVRCCRFDTSNYTICCCCCFCGFKAQQCMGQRYGLKTLSTTRKPPFPHEVLVSGFKLRDSKSRPPYSRPRALTTRLYTIHEQLYLFIIILIYKYKYVSSRVIWSYVSIFEMTDHFSQGNESQKRTLMLEMWSKTLFFIPMGLAHTWARIRGILP